jgi:hypothetical protein
MQEINLGKEDTPKPTQTEPSLAEKVDALWSDANNIVKKRELKLPRKAKVKKRKAKKGWVGIIKIDENNNISGEKVQLRDATYKTRDGIIHATDGKEMLMWNGKFPVFIQEAKKNNPKLFKFNEGENQNYGQPYIRAKMLQEAIKPKKAGMSIIIWLLAAGVVIFLISKSGLFGGGA